MNQLRITLPAALALLATTLVACPDEPGRPLGATCTDDSQCESGLCVDGLCVDPSFGGDDDTSGADATYADVSDSSDAPEDVADIPETSVEVDPDTGPEVSPEVDVPVTPDPVAPVTLVTVEPPALTNDDVARFEFASDPPGAAFDCTLDADPPEPCDSPLDLVVDEGEHTLVIVARSADGLTDPEPPRVTWRVDLTPPVTTITAAPATFDNSVSTLVEFVADEAATFSCRLDAGAFAPCASPWLIDALADGPHSFTIRATDAAGNVEDAPAFHAWTLDTSTPDAQIDVGPIGAVSSPEATFVFTSSTPGTTFTCALDSAPPAACTSPVQLDALPDGDHTFTVVATSASGVVDPSPAVRTWTVDTVAPTVSITAAPPALGNDATPTLKFAVDDALALIACRVDADPFAACTSPYTPAKLADGDHTIELRATDAAGNSTTELVAFVVDTSGPSLTVSSGPSGPTNEASPAFTFVAGPDTAATQCRFDLADFEACTSPHYAVRLPDGAHTFYVRATDTLGNTTTTSRAFSVDTTAPTITIVSGPSGPTNDNPPTFMFAPGQGATSTQCRIDTGAWVNCTSPRTTASLTQGAHTFYVRVADALGNDATASRSFTIDTVAPTVAITSGPANGALLSNANDVTYTFTTSGATTVQCRLYQTGQVAPAYTSCSSPYTRSIDIAPYTFQVRVMDAAGNGMTITRTFTNANIG